MLQRNAMQHQFIGVNLLFGKSLACRCILNLLEIICFYEFYKIAKKTIYFPEYCKPSVLHDFFS